MIIQLGHRANGAARAANWVRLINRDRGQDTFDLVYNGLVHSIKELSSVGGECLDIASLSFGVQRVKSQGAFTGAANARHHGQFARVQSDIEIF